MYLCTGTDLQAKQPQAKPIRWFEGKEGVANADEVLWYQLLIAEPVDGVVALNNWARALVAERSRAEQLKEHWSPLETSDWPMRNGVSSLFARLSDRISGPITDEELDRVGAAMETLGGCKELRAGRLKPYLAGTRAKSIFGKRPSSKARAQPRWRSWQLVDIAQGVLSNGAALRRALRGEEEPHLTTEEQLDAAVELNEELLNENAELEADRTRLLATNRQQRKRAGEHVEAKKAMRQEVRERERQKAAAAVQQAREAEQQKAAAACAREVADLDLAVQRAQERARKVESQAKLSRQRLKRAQASEATIIELRDELDDLRAPPSDGESDDEPTTKTSRRNAEGRFTAGPWQHRVLQWAQIGRGVNPSHVNANITEVLTVFAKDAVVPLACKQEMRRLRTEVTIAGEMIAAIRVALCCRIISFGFDESTKFGLGLLSTNTQIEPHDAPGTSVDVVMRGVTLTAQRSQTTDQSQ